MTMLSKSRYTATRVVAPSVTSSIYWVLLGARGRSGGFGRLSRQWGAGPTCCLAGQPGKVYPLQGPCAGQAPLAQSAERFHGKEKVNGSIPLGGSAHAGLAGGAAPQGDVAQSVRANDS